MQAQLQIKSIAIHAKKINPTRSDSAIGHDFCITIGLRAIKGKLPFIEPVLQWNEVIEWFKPKPEPLVMGGHREPQRGTTMKMGGHRENDALQWLYAGAVTEDMYAKNPSSNTFFGWNSRWTWYDYKSDPKARKAISGARDEKAAIQEYLAKNGGEWSIDNQDRPGLSLFGGGHGGGGASLVIGDTRRRVIYFDLGFNVPGPRVTAVQVLEVQKNVPTIHKFLSPGYSKAVVDDSRHLARWRRQVNEKPQSFTL